MSAIEWGQAAGLGYLVVVEILSQQRRDVPAVIVYLFLGAEVTRQVDERGACYSQCLGIFWHSLFWRVFFLSSRSHLTASQNT